MPVVELDELGSSDHPIITEQGRRLARSGTVSAAPSALVPGHWDIAARGKVGAARIGDIDLWVRPKLDIARLLFMVGYAIDPKGWRDDEIAMGTGDDLVPAVANALWRQTERAVRQGLLQGYREVEETSYVLRGRLREADQLRRHHGRVIPMELRHDDFTVDVTENQILLAAITRMLAVPRVNRRSRQRLTALRLRLADATTLVRGTRFAELAAKSAQRPPPHGASSGRDRLAGHLTGACPRRRDRHRFPVRPRQHLRGLRHGRARRVAAHTRVRDRAPPVPVLHGGGRGYERAVLLLISRIGGGYMGGRAAVSASPQAVRHRCDTVGQRHLMIDRWFGPACPKKRHHVAAEEAADSRHLDQQRIVRWHVVLRICLVHGVSSFWLSNSPRRPTASRTRIPQNAIMLVYDQGGSHSAGSQGDFR
ncbi:5-methylcytosine restriction system specificity protein McrC [Actinophytocola algeriensis]|uniref:Uncharacterized protein n=1 Tax=Actinophytocola algeriensis TaxID=1768010 RepID=A0A7W7VDJ5_9PSEU|nr:hypothetical protein [Actinophytocola algeriensis]MBB4906268.1 hypothetical protein [Actinophytocola algeriensis]MBE1472047.1 hypothetical protein [Actinophytocola algeriensis]